VALANAGSQADVAAHLGRPYTLARVCSVKRNYAGFVVVSATSGDHTAMLTSGFDSQHGVSYSCSIVTIALKCTVFELRDETDRLTDGQMDCGKANFNMRCNAAKNFLQPLIVRYFPGHYI